MPLTRLFDRISNAWVFAALGVYWFVLVTMLHWPRTEPPPPDPPPTDKVAHFFLYGVLAALVVVAVDRVPGIERWLGPRHGWRRAVAVLGLVAVQAFADEFTQPWSNRDFEWLDLAADAAGTAVALAWGVARRQ